MESLFDELSAKLAEDPRLSRRGGPRADLGLLMFNARDAVRDLWDAADRAVRSGDARALEDLRTAAEALRPIFGERTGS